MKNVTKYIIGATLAVLIVGFLGFQLQRTKNEAETWKENYLTEASEFDIYKSEASGIITQYKSQISLTENELKKQLSDNDSLKRLVKYYKKIASVTTVKTEWKHDTIKVQVPVYIVDNKDLTIAVGDSCFKANLTVFNGGLSINDLSIYNEQNVVTGVRKVGFMKKEYSFDVMNSNPCLTVTGMNSYKVTTKPKFFENPLYTGIAGFLVGVLVESQINK